MSDPIFERFMRRAIELSHKNMQSNDGGPFGAVIVRDGNVVAEGWNRVTSTNDPTAHAEVDAIRNACQALGTFSLEGCEIYTSCEPCPMCLSAIYWARIKKIYFGNSRKDAAEINFDDDLIYSEVSKPIDQRIIPAVQILGSEAKKVFRSWTEKNDKTPY